MERRDASARPEDVAALGAAMRELSLDPAKRRPMRRRAREAVAASSYDRQAVHLSEIYERAGRSVLCGPPVQAVPWHGSSWDEAAVVALKSLDQGGLAPGALFLPEQWLPRRLRPAAIHRAACPDGIPGALRHAAADRSAALIPSGLEGAADFVSSSGLERIYSDARECAATLQELLA